MRINKFIPSSVILPLISVFFLIFASCKSDYRTCQGETWGTYYHIVYSSPLALDDSIGVQLAFIDNEFSLFNPRSLVSRVNEGLTDSVSERFVELLSVCREVNFLSKGVFDPTVGPVVNLWGFGSDGFKSIPSEAAIDSALQYVGLGECELLLGNRLKKKAPGTVFDFSSVAKGFGVDCIANMLERNGCENYMIEIGGEVAVKGRNPKGLPWKIQVDSPASGMGHDAMCVLSLGPERTALATSGNYRNFINAGDSIFGHTISPHSGRPVKGQIISATIKAGSCALADALATACMASATKEASEEIVNKACVGAIIVSCDLLGRTYVFNHGMED